MRAKTFASLLILCGSSAALAAIPKAAEIQVQNRTDVSNESSVSNYESPPSNAADERTPTYGNSTDTTSPPAPTTPPQN